MKNAIPLILALVFISTISAQCVNLSDDTTYGFLIVNNSGVLEVNGSVVLCGDTYHLPSGGFAAPALFVNAANVSLDCNGSVFDGTDGTGYGIRVSGVENVTVANCSVSNYSLAFEITWVNNSFILDNNAFDNLGTGFDMKSFSNNTVVNNTAYNNAWYGFVFDIATLGDFDMYNVLIDDVAYNNSDIGFWLRDTAMYNNLTNCLVYNQTSFFYQEDIGSASNNLTNFTVGYNATAGLISFGFINQSSLALYQYPLGSYLYVQPDFVSLYSEFLPQANVASTITIEGNCSMGVLRAPGFLYTTKDEILSAGLHYATDISCSGGIASFDVAGFTSYTIGEERTDLTLSILPDTTVSFGTETSVSCSATNSEVNLTLYRDGVEVNSSFSSVQETATLPIGTYAYECNATGSGNYTNATTSGTLDVASCTNISSPMAYTMTYNMEGLRSYGFTQACVYISSSDVTLDCDGYNITGAAGTNYGIYVAGFLGNVSIYNCSVSNYSDGIYAGSAYMTVANNDLFNNTNSGATLSGGSTNVSSNRVHNNTQYGLLLGGDNNRVFNNTVYDSPAGIGLFVNSAYNSVFNNTLFGNYYGVYFNSATYSNLTENRIENNSLYGLNMAGGFFDPDTYNTITNNIIQNNSIYQIVLSACSSNLFYNNIVNASGAQGVIQSDSLDYWNSSKTLGTNIIGGAYQGGNFYSNYTGADTDGDGIGNTPYIVNAYSGSVNVDVYASEYGSSGTWTTFANTYDQDWDTYGTAEALAVGYYNFTIPAGASTMIATGSIKTGGVGGIGVPSTTTVPFGTMFGTDCLSTDPLQVKVEALNFKGTITPYMSCWDYGAAGWSAPSTAGGGDATAVDIYELNATFQVSVTSNVQDYLPLTNNLNYAPNVTIVSIGGQGNGGEITSLTPDIVFNATDADNSTLNCTVYVDAITPGGTNDTVENGTLTTITLSYSLTAGQTYSFTVNCTDNTTVSASSAWTETVAGGSTASSSSNPSVNQPLSIIAEDEVPAGSSMQITVEREGGVTLPSALVVISFAGDTVFTGYTDPWGHVLFTPENAGTYRIVASKLGYVTANDSFVAVATECASNNDCAYDEKCTQGACEKVPEGECGAYSNHAWEDYACCASSDCGENEQCTNHECVQRPEEPETGCTIDSQCQQGYRCASGTCVQEPLTPPPECVEDGDCQQGFRCSSNACVEVPTTPGGNVTGPGEPLQPGTQGGLGGTILNLWWLWLIIIALVAYYIYKRSRETKA
ncbi:MAG: NosD domain-containing protein [Candidatus Micrarchaeia archaeon]